MKKVFQAHPKAKELFVVKGMPFLKENDAKTHCDDLKISYDEIEVVAKGASASKAANDADKKAKDEAAAAKKAADKKAKDEAAVAKKAVAADKKTKAAAAKKAKADAAKAE